MIELDQVLDPIAGIVVEHPQLFVIQIAQKATEDLKSILRGVDGRPFGGMGIETGIELVVQLAQFGQGLRYPVFLALLGFRVRKAIQDQLGEFSLFWGRRSIVVHCSLLKQKRAACQ